MKLPRSDKSHKLSRRTLEVLQTSLSIIRFQIKIGTREEEVNYSPRVKKRLQMLNLQRLDKVERRL